MEIKGLSNKKLIETYGNIIHELKERKIIRSKNLVGDLGEYLAINHYCNTPGLVKLQFAPPSTKNIDAISINGERYSIKSTSSGTTSVFYGLNSPESSQIDSQKFEYVLLVMFDDSYRLKRINEITWEKFLKHKRWHSRMKAWNLSVTNSLLEDTTTILNNE